MTLDNGDGRTHIGDMTTATTSPSPKVERMAKPLGIVAYEGPSALGGAPIAVIVTGLSGRRSKNSKTGAMLQTWIIRTDVEPVAARRAGQDKAICGWCPLAGGQGCYVRVEQAPLAVFRAYHRGRYAVAGGAGALTRLIHQLTPSGYKLRVGSYGDPAACPRWVWTRLLAGAAGHTGYTHQWRSHYDLSSIAMASVHSLEERAEAKALGFRTFRAGPGEAGPGEVLCPASEEAGKRTTCENCTLCKGRGFGGANYLKDVFIPLHGAFTYKALRAIEVTK